MKIQDIPVPDSPNYDAFEAVVELYYQINGYITSSGKWFWVWETGKRQRGYQDIDVLAISEHYVKIISVTTCLDDKLRTGRDGQIKEDMAKKVSSYFTRVESYLSNVDDYNWLVNGKEIKKVIAYSHSYKRKKSTIEKKLREMEIELISSKHIIQSLQAYTKQKNLKIQDHMLRLIQLTEIN